MEFNDEVKTPCVVTFRVNSNEDVSSFERRAINPVENFKLVRTVTRLIVESSERIRRTSCEVTDLVTQERNPLAGKAKDIAASSVLVAAISSVIIGIIIFGNHVLETFR